MSFTREMRTDFDVGQDTFECAIQKLYREYRIADVAPHMCKGYLAERSQTKWTSPEANARLGGNKCDFRLKFGRKTVVRSTVVGKLNDSR